MQEFLNIFKNYANFKDRTTRKGFWMAFLFWIIAMIVLAIVDTLLGTGGSYVAAPGSISLNGGLITSVFLLGSFIPMLAAEIRRLRDAGLPWQHIFFGLIPLAGGIIMLVKLCKPSAPGNDLPVV